jgi:hypothetical protein
MMAPCHAAPTPCASIAAMGAAMTGSVATTEPLVLDRVEWVGRAPRRHAEVMAVRRTSCPRLTVREDAMERGLAACRSRFGALWIEATAAGRAALAAAHRNEATASA